MNDLSPDRAERSAKLKGLGHSRKRVEDQRVYPRPWQLYRRHENA